MSRRDAAAASAASARAIDSVLQAERAAADELAREREVARQAVERAREDALATVNRALDRIGRWRQAHARSLQQRVQALRVAAEVQALAAGEVDDAALDAAVERVAAWLTGAQPPEGSS